MDHIAKKTGISASKILGVATFYAQFKFEPVGKHLIMLCQGTACHVNGSADIQDAICSHLGISEGETTKDRLFTLNSVACLGCCSLSPVMMIDGEAYGSLTSTKTVKILDAIRKS
jgi:NADH-quinone oxidoreductase subunit E